MKQLIFNTGTLYKDESGYGLSDLSNMPKNSVGVFQLDGGRIITSSISNPGNIAIAHNNGNNIVVYPEIDIKTLSVSVAEAKPAVHRKVIFTVPSTMDSGYGKFATVIITKCGTVLNERNNFSFTVPVNTNFTPTLVADALATAIMNNVSGMQYDTELLVNATASGGVLTIESTDDRFNFNVTLADELMNVPFDTEVEFEAPILDAKYIQDLMHKCRGGKGYQHADCKEPWELYKGDVYNVPELIDQTYKMITLRFAVPRASAKQRDEVVYQTIHVIGKSGSGGFMDDFEQIFDEFIII